MRPRNTSRLARALLFAAASATLGCQGGLDAPPPPSSQQYTPGPVVFPRLTEAQYRASVEEALGGDEGPLPQLPLEPDTNPYLFYNVGAASTTLSSVGTERYEASAHAIAEAVILDATRRRALLGCEPMTPGDACVSDAITRLGRRLYRRPLTSEESARWRGIATTHAHGSAVEGLRLALAGMLQSASFLYRIELGEPDTAGDRARAGWRRYTDLELASRMSFLLWNTGPDDALLDAALAGRLATQDGVHAEAMRMLEDPRAHRAVRAFFAQYFDLSRLNNVTERDATLHPLFTPTLASAMRTEIELLVEDVVFTRDVDVRELLRTQRTFVNAELAQLYELNVPSATPITFVPAELPQDGPRAGLLTLGAFLMANAHPTETSPTLRGKYIRERLLCDLVPAPPEGVVTEIPEPVGVARTLRERLEQHRSNPSCATCHQVVDPPGYLFEGFDSIGRARTLDHGYPVDTSGGLDEVPLRDGRELGEFLAEDPRVSRCIARQLFRHANGRLEREEEEPAVRSLGQEFLVGGSHFTDLLLALVTHESFRYAAPSPEAGSER